jgi:hypothetical protein
MDVNMISKQKDNNNKTIKINWMGVVQIVMGIKITKSNQIYEIS